MKLYKEIITSRNGTQWLVTLEKVSTYKYRIADSKLIINWASPVVGDGGNPTTRK